MRWVAVVPVKALPSAKTRLAAWSAVEREQLALAFARDTVEAALAVDAIREVVVVTSDARVSAALRGPGVVLVDEPEPSGLNAALVAGAAIARHREISSGVLALCADLPALRHGDLTEALAAAEPYARAFVADASGEGTTLLSAGPGQALDPLFGPGSAARHGSSGARALPDPLTSLRRDVDSPDDLSVAVALGVGRWTASALRLH